MLKQYTKDLLDSALIDNGKLEPHLTPAMISKVVQDTVEISQYWSVKRSLKIEIQNKMLAQDEPCVQIDVQRI